MGANMDITCMGRPARNAIPVLERDALLAINRLAALNQRMATSLGTIRLVNIGVIHAMIRVMALVQVVAHATRMLAARACRHLTTS